MIMEVYINSCGSKKNKMKEGEAPRCSTLVNQGAKKNMDYIIKTIETLVNIPSPSGFTKDVMNFVKEEANRFGYHCDESLRGGLIITVPGKSEKTVGLSAHVDTLGAMVRSITSSGALRFTLVGGFTMHSVEGSYVKYIRGMGEFILEQIYQRVLLFIVMMMLEVLNVLKKIWKYVLMKRYPQKMM